MSMTKDFNRLVHQANLLKAQLDRLEENIILFNTKLIKIEKKKQYQYTNLQPVWVRNGIDTCHSKWYLRYFKRYTDNGNIETTIGPNIDLPCDQYAWPIHQPVIKPEE